MNENGIYLIIGTICLTGGYLLGAYLKGLKLNAQLARQDQRRLQLEEALEQKKDELTDTQNNSKTLSTENIHLSNGQIRLQADLENLQQKHWEQKAQTEQLQQRFIKEFENLANKILEEKSIRFTQRNEKNIKHILTPLSEKIQLFEKKVEASQKENYGIHRALREQLHNLQSQNLKITQEAENLTKALKGDSKMQGNWGELVLERVLEKSGLEKDREYSVQQQFERQDGSRVFPDVVIHLPNGKKMIVDSKVSLVAYERMVNADDANSQTHLKEHVASIRKHVVQLSAKRYEELYAIESPDFVLMFIPIEPAFAVALNFDSSLYNQAFEKNVIIVTPSTLLATLRTIDSMWNNEKQQRNAIEIARQAGALYDKFEGFVANLNRIGKKLDDAKSEYSSAKNKLVDGSGNLVSRVQKLKQMGAKAKKNTFERFVA